MQALFGEFLVAQGLITTEQLGEGLGKQQALREQPIGEILVELKILSREQLDSALPTYFFSLLAADEAGRRFGEFLIDKKLISANDLERGLDEQRRRRALRIGEVLVELGHMATPALEKAVQVRSGERLDPGGVSATSP